MEQFSLPSLTGVNHRAEEGGLWMGAGRIELDEGACSAFASGTATSAEVHLAMESGRWCVSHNLTPQKARDLGIALMRAAQEVERWEREVRK